MQKRILIAEDNKFTAIQYTKLLESQNHFVDVSIDGDECIKKYNESIDKSSNKSNFDVILLDHSMPMKSGAEIAADILSSNPDQKIIIASAYALSTEKNYSKLKDKLIFLQKPFELSKILELI
ncbi:MAG: response regulator [Thaumarchaeota archaeon]|nr:response regulator [Nitrososphaerota archaeon]